MIKGRKVYDPLTDTWSTGYCVADDKGNYYPVWQKGAAMERLTKVMSCPNGTKIYDISNKLFGLNISRADKTRMILEKLAEYEDLEEQGRLIKLPCKVGTDIYYILGIPNETPCTIDKCTFELSDINKIGKTLFLTREEAEVKLKELRGGENDG